MSGDQEIFARGLLIKKPRGWRQVDAEVSASGGRICEIASRYGVSQLSVAATATLLLLERYVGQGISVLASAASVNRGAVIPPSVKHVGATLQAVEAQLTGADNSDATYVPAFCRVALDDAPMPDQRTAPGGLRLDVSMRRTGITLRYREGCHAPWLAAQFVHHLGRVLDRWFDDGAAPVAQLPMLDATEAAAIAAHCAGPVRPYRLNQPLLELFDGRQRETPDAVAAIGEAGDGSLVRLSYRELGERIETLARRLAATGTARCAPVAVLTRRSIDTVAAPLAIWRVGGVYVPLDRSFPPEYLREILEHCGARLLIADDDAPPFALPRQVQIVSFEEGPERAYEDMPAATSEPCLIMYTSGSTGRPKGVVHSQKQILNRLNWMWEACPFVANDVIAQRSPLMVMPSVWELLGGLLAGVPTAVVPDAHIRDPVALAEFLHRAGVTFITMTPTLLGLMLEKRPRTAGWLEMLRVMIIGGEPLTEASQQALEQASPNAILVDDFGATEINTALHVVLTPAADDRARRGGYRPIANASTCILDDHMRFVPFGVIGELCVAGPMVALEYLGLPDVTAARFVEARPDDAGPPLRFYRTGDMGCMAPDGLIRMVGRRDHQVKIGGLRVELTEIERVLARHPAIAECAIVHRSSRTGRSTLDAHLTVRGGAAPDVSSLRSFLSERLPRHMVPARFLLAQALPRRPNGKIDRAALAACDIRQGPMAPSAESRGGSMTQTVMQALAEILEIAPAEIDPNAVFVSLGLDSVGTIELAALLSDILERDVPPTLLFDRPSVIALSRYLEEGRAPGRASQLHPTTSDIAIIGMSGRFPHAADMHQFWDRLRAGLNSVTTVPSERWDITAIYDSDPAAEGKSYSKWGGFLEGVDEFDPAFFRLTAAEARAMDPQQRLCLQEAWRALENAGHAGDSLNDNVVGVFVGARESDYPSVIAAAGGTPGADGLLGNDLSLIAARISYFCDLHGPSLVVDTACSSSLVATHLACRSVLDGECSMALAGGVCVTNDPAFYVATSRLNVFSPTGACRAFDAGADGFVHGEGVGFVVLKRLDAAIADNDHIYAVIRGSAVNQDGRSNGLAAPNGEAQASLTEALYRKLRIDPATIGYVEAHGTGTKLGDPIEIEALTRSFRRFTNRRGYCAIGSVKTNIGHLTAASGIAGLIKTALCLFHGELVPSLNFQRPNPLIDFDTSPFYVCVENQPWPQPPGGVRRAAVSAFGIGGTNTHCVLDEPPPRFADTSPTAPAFLVAVTAPNAAAALRSTAQLARWIESDGRNHALRDIAHSLLVGRRMFDHGYVMVARDLDQLGRQLDALASGASAAGALSLQPAPDGGRDASVRIERAVAAAANLGFSAEHGAAQRDAYHEHLFAVAELLAMGGRTDWRPLFKDQAARRIPLPGYVFSRDRYWAGRDAPSCEIAAAPFDLQGRVAQAVAGLLGVGIEQVPLDVPLPVLGFDSIRAVALKHALKNDLGREPPLEWLLEQSVGGLSRLLAQAVDGGEEPAIRRAPEKAIARRTASDTGDFPLTDLQASHFVARRMQDVDPVGCHAYTEFPVADLDVRRLERAWEQVLRIHPMLLARVNGNATQRIETSHPSTHLTVHDTVAETLDNHLEALRSRLSHRVYKPGDWPLFEIAVTRCAGRPSRVHVSMDAWIADGASAITVHRDWRRLYQSPDADIRPPSVTFRDLTLDASTPGDGTAAAYWIDKLADRPAAPWLPYRKAGEIQPDAHKRRRLHWACPAQDWTAFTTRLAKESVSPSAGLLGVLIDLLRGSGQPDRFALVLMVYNRPGSEPDIGRVVGPFSSTAIFVAQDEPGTTFAGRLRNYQRQLARDLDHGRVSGVAAMRNVSADRGGWRLPVAFTSMLGLVDAGESWLDEVDFAVTQTPGIDLDVHVYWQAGQAHIAFDFAAGRFEPNSIESLFDDLCMSVAYLGSHGLDAANGSLAFGLEQARRATQLASAPPPNGRIPMSPLQRSLATHRLTQRDAKPSIVYREFEAATLDVPRLQAAVNAMIARHPILRAAPRLDRAEFIEFPQAYLPVTVEDLSALDGERQARALQSTRARAIGAMAGKESWPAFTLHVSVLGESRALLHVALDPLVFDGFGTWLFYRELFDRCAARGAEPKPPPQGPDCADLARVRDKHRRSARGAGDLLYWERHFESSPAGPTWRPFHGARDAIGETRTELTFASWVDLKRAAVGLDLQPAAVLAAVYREALRRAFGGSAPTVTIASYGARDLAPGFRQSFNDFSSLAWIEGGDGPEGSVVARARHIAASTMLDQLHDWGDPFVSLRHVPSGLVVALTDCLEAPQLLPGDPVVGFSYVSMPGVDIDLMVHETDTVLTSSWQVRTDRVPPTVMTSAIEAYRQMLAAVANDSTAWERPLAALAAVAQTGDGTPTIVHPCNDTDAIYDSAIRIEALVAGKALAEPDRTALITAEERLSYGELDRRANRLANHLRARGVVRGDCVGILLHRCPDMVVAVLAILKAGAAYVPLGIDDPDQRIAAMLDQARVRLVVSQSPLAGRLESFGNIVLLDRERAAIDRRADVPPPASGQTSQDVAYVMFTSGTTGRPKGVTVRHRSVVNLLEWAGKTYGFGPSDCVLFVNALGFDLSVFDVFGLLAHGGSVRIASDTERLDPADLARILAHEPITFWNSAPAYLQYLLPALAMRADGLKHSRLRLVFLSGDRIPLEMPSAVRAVFPAASQISLGGATEATVWSNHFPIGHVDPAWKSIPYGRPIQNARYYVLDDDMRPCGAGETGDLYIGGDCLADGYVHAPELTANAFVPDPFHERPDMRMYRTGDMARLRPEGDFELVGRLDDQVKLRGFRIELREVEAGLSRAGLDGPVAIVHEDGRGGRRIIAFARSAAGSGGPVDQAYCDRLRRELPDYMIPAEIHLLPTLPMTANGKVDRRQLAAHANAAPAPRAKDADGPAGRRTERIEMMTAALAKSLDLAPDVVGRLTHFSTLGISSLQFALLSARLEEDFGIVISPAKLFGCNTVAEIDDILTDLLPETLPTRAAESAQTPAAVHHDHGELAVIGMHCRMPGSDGADAFWTNIVNGRDCIEPVPAERASMHADIGNGARRGDGAAACKAGFMAHMDKFDAAFFAIAPREAESMDPRQRILLEGVWATLEDAGYRPSELRRAPVGVFVGSTGDEYAALLRQAGLPSDAFSLTGCARSLLANRISYVFDWHGPSEVVDTTCSSSLVALHNAMRAIQAGDCEMAIVGGVSILIDSFPHLSLAELGILSPDSACRTFDSGANGYVRGEGLGLLLLKPLNRALEDRDNIHAVISGSAVNHGGRANSMTAPQPRAQAQVIVEAHRRSGVDPCQVAYIEAHGTGTPLGDPIEIEGLKEALSVLERDRGERLPAAMRISVGSVKAGIGHLEAAAGIAGVIKAILMLRRRTLPPLAHFRELNPQIDVAGTPFVFQAAASPWPAPTGSDGRALLRAVGVSSFGLGGVNAHAVLRELPSAVRLPESSRPKAFPLSARGEAQLARYAGRLAEFLGSGSDHPSLDDIAYTLARGREVFETRAVVVAQTLDALVAGLTALAEGRPWQGLYRGKAERSGGDAAGVDFTTLDAAAQAWVTGARSDCPTIEDGAQRRRVSMPTYPFLRTRHWPAALLSPEPSALPGRADDANSIFLTGAEPFVRDHVVDGKPILPAAAYLGFLMKAGERVWGTDVISVQNLTWVRPLAFAGPSGRRLSLALDAKQAAYRATFSTLEAGQTLECASGLLSLSSKTKPPSAVDIEAIRRGLSRAIDGEACYARLSQLGLAFGPSLRSVRKLWLGESEAVAKLVLAEPTSQNSSTVCAADAALQVVALHTAMSSDVELRDQTFLPFAVRRITAHARLTKEAYVHARLTAGGNPAAPRRYDIAVTGMDGGVLLSFEQCTALRMPRSAAAPSPVAELCREVWRPANAKLKADGVDAAAISHITVGLPAFAKALADDGHRVLANAMIPAAIPDDAARGSRVPWAALLREQAAAAPKAIVIWYDGEAVSRAKGEEQLRLGFDTVLDLTQLLIVDRRFKRCAVIVAVISSRGSEAPPALAALTGFAHVVHAECPKLAVKVMDCRGDADLSARPARNAMVAAAIRVLASPAEAVEHRFEIAAGRHETRETRPDTASIGPAALPIATRGLYLISGGAGGIGRRLGREILDRGGSVLLLGRRSGEEVRAELAETFAEAPGVRYVQADVSDRLSLARALRTARDGMGPVRGVFHCAGEARGGLLLRKSLDTARAVLAGKVSGAWVLDEATRSDPLDFFVLFSSLASTTGPIGAADYAFASRYLDLFATHRARDVANGIGRGKTVTISWPVWSGIGMGASAKITGETRSKGLGPIDAGRAIEILAQCLSRPEGHYVCRCTAEGPASNTREIEPRALKEHAYAE